ncbi:hypothetical protein H671_2g7525 [Cricetulus griseus]|nr:hypothetical protein H671_2g7525 [Cricetulus griseus]
MTKLTRSISVADFHLCIDMFIQNSELYIQLFAQGVLPTITSLRQQAEEDPWSRFGPQALDDWQEERSPHLGSLKPDCFKDEVVFHLGHTIETGSMRQWSQSKSFAQRNHVCLS